MNHDMRAGQCRRCGAILRAQESVRLRALLKLSPEERAALGVS